MSEDQSNAGDAIAKKPQVKLNLRLVDLLLKQETKGFVKETKERMKDFLRKIGHYSTTEPNREELLQLAAEQWRKWIEIVFRVAGEVRQKRHRSKGPAFYRQLWEELISKRIAEGWAFAAELSRVAVAGSPIFFCPLSPEDWEPYEAEIREDWKDRLDLTVAGFGGAEVDTSTGTPGIEIPRRSQERASDVAKIIKELNILRPQMFGRSDYERLKNQHPDFLTFQVARDHPELELKVVHVQDNRRHIRLAQELVAALHGRELETVLIDWKRYKPPEFRQKLR